VLKVHVPVGGSTVTPELKVRLSGKEKIARLVDDAGYNARLCAGFKGAVDVWLGHDSQSEGGVQLTAADLPSWPGASAQVPDKTPFLLPVQFTMDPLQVTAIH
jgi:hypothetical protein